MTKTGITVQLTGFIMITSILTGFPSLSSIKTEGFEQYQYYNSSDAQFDK